MDNLKTSIVIDVVNRATEPIRRITRQLQGIKTAAGPGLSDLTAKVGALGRSVATLGGSLGILGAGATWAFKSQLIDTASQFERFTAILETVEKSSSKAKISMGWISDFAAKTPYELGEVTDAFAKLRAYGFDPTNGLLKSIGDVSAAKDKQMQQGVEAVADAVMGNFERLKEFAQMDVETKGNKIRINYQNSTGAQQFKVLDKRNRQLIASTLQAIWNEQYAGAMEKQSKTWGGMISNVSDQWTRFKLKIMDAGAFEFLKTKLSGLLALLDKMAADGSLNALAQKWGKKLVDGMQRAWVGAQKIWAAMGRVKEVVDKVAGALGGYDKLLIAVGATMALNVAVKVAQLIVSLTTLGATVLPMVGTAFVGMSGLAVKSIAAITTALSPLAAVLLPITAALGVLSVPGWAPQIAEKNAAAQYGIMGTRKLEGLLGQTATTGGGPNSIQARMIRQELGKRYADEADRQFNGKIQVEIKSAHPVRVKELKSSHNLDLEVDSGLTMLNPGY
jgi:phage tail tape-measure protein